MLDELEERIRLARQDRAELDRLICDYLPFIKKQAAAYCNLPLDSDDVMSLSMLVFANCIRQYEGGRGGFLSFVRLCIRNRILDEARREERRGTVIPLFEEEEATGAEADASVRQYDREMERENLAAEIDALSAGLKDYGIIFSELPFACPRQDRARRQCLTAARAVLSDAALSESFHRQGKLPQKELAQRLRLSVKTVEKHRKYIVTLIILLEGDYPAIRAFLPQREEGTA